MKKYLKIVACCLLFIVAQYLLGNAMANDEPWYWQVVMGSVTLVFISYIVAFIYLILKILEII